jgi:hypothetical protein
LATKNTEIPERFVELLIVMKQQLKFETKSNLAGIVIG